MAFDCDFAPEFWLAEDEPYDRPELALNAEGKPVSVYSAICLALEDEAWCTHAAGWLDEALGMNVCGAMPEALFELAEVVNTCGTLASPVDVWLTPGGEVSVLVYEDSPRTGSR